MRNSGTAVGVFVLLVVSAALVNSASADTVYLKNGREIHSSIVRVEEDRVVVKQYDGLVAFPMELVDRVEENDRVEPGGYVPPQPEPKFDDVLEGDAATEGDAPAEGDAGAEGDAPEESDTGAEGAAPEEGAAPPEEGQAAAGPVAQPDPPEDPKRDKAYWQGRLRPIFSQIDRAETERREYVQLARTSAEAQRQLDRLDRHLADLETQAEAIRTEARRLNVPAGWLRR